MIAEELAMLTRWVAAAGLLGALCLGMAGGARATDQVTSAATPESAAPGAAVSAATPTPPAAVEAAAAPIAPLDGVAVSVLRDPDSRFHSQALRAMDLFERKHAMAPAADLRIRLFPRHSGVDMAGIEVKLVGRDSQLALTVDAESRFEVPRAPQMSSTRKPSW